MCRIFAVKNYSARRHLPAAAAFLELAVSGNVPRSWKPGHGEGWGIASYASSGKPSVIKSGGSAADEKEKILSILRRINRSKVLFLHLRKSSWRGSVRARHSHPFAYGRDAFAHNGTVYEYKKLLADIPRDMKPASDSLDTEVLFRFLASKVSNAALPCGLPGAYKEAARLRHSSLTSVFTDGVKLCAFREYKKLPGYYTLYAARRGKSLVLSSEPLKGIPLKWRLLKRGELLVV